MKQHEIAHIAATKITVSHYLRGLLPNYLQNVKFLNFMLTVSDFVKLCACPRHKKLELKMNELPSLNANRVYMLIWDTAHGSFC